MVKFLQEKHLRGGNFYTKNILSGEIFTHKTFERVKFLQEKHLRGGNFYRKNV